MQINKKLNATLIITLLTISALIAAIPMVSAEITTNPFIVTEGGTTAVAGGAVGTQIDVVGNSTSGLADSFATVTIYLDALSGTVLGTVSADNTGAYRKTITIPETIAGSHYIIVNDGETESGGTIFDITPTISTSVSLALPGDTVTVTGKGYAANDDITLTLNSTTLTTPYSTTLTVTPTSNALGSFEVDLTVPVIAFADFDVYNLNGTDEDMNVAFTPINIDYYIKLTPTAGPTGITTTISGRIKPNVAYSITFNSASIASGTTTADGSYSATYTIPGVLGPAGYPVVITWETTNTRTATFTVTAPPTIVLGAPNGISGTVVTITGSGFSGSANITLYFGSTVVNSTTMNAAFGKTTSGGALPTGLTFVVPTIAPGVYPVSVVDQYGATSASGVFFTIDATPVFMAETSATQYMRMDFLSIKALSTSATDVILRIADPNGLIWYQEAVAAGEWQMISGAYQIPYNALDLTWWPITSDAPLGNWNFTCWNSGATQILDTNLFTVVAKPTQQDVLDALDDMEGTIQGLITTSEGKIIAAVNTKTGTIITDLSALMPKLQGIEDMGVIIATMLGEVQVDLANLDMSVLTSLGVDITAIKGDVATIKSNIGTVNTAVSNLDAKVTSVSGNVATIQTTLGTWEGIILGIDGKTATIETGVGALQADITDVKADVGDFSVDMTPVWIAVVLSLVAAIAAIFAVITIRQKIAG